MAWELPLKHKRATHSKQLYLKSQQYTSSWMEHYSGCNYFNGLVTLLWNIGTSVLLMHYPFISKGPNVSATKCCLSISQPVDHVYRILPVAVIWQSIHPGIPADAKWWNTLDHNLWVLRNACHYNVWHPCLSATNCYPLYVSPFANGLWLDLLSDILCNLVLLTWQLPS